MARTDLDLPTIDDFELLKDTLVSLGEESDAVVRSVDNRTGISIFLTRMFLDCDFSGYAPLTVHFFGKVRFLSGDSPGHKMVIRYKEVAGHPYTFDTYIKHDYILGTQDEELVEFGHSLRGTPMIEEPKQDKSMADKHLDQADMGKRILQTDFGSNLELTAGDCEILFDRMLGLMS